MKKTNAGWFPAAAVSLAIHCAVFGCAAWALGAKKEYVPTELFRLREAPMVAHSVQPVSRTPAKEPTPEPPLSKIKPIPRPQPVSAKSEPAVEKPKPVEQPVATADAPSPVSEPEAPPAPRVEAQNAPPAPQLESPPVEPIYRGVDQLSALPYFRTGIKPVYPRSALRTGKKARVVVEVFINEKGEVDDVRIAQSGGEEFDAAVIAALKQSQFEPGYMAGRAVAVKVLIPFNFRVG